jgi:hypothetical protein
LERISEQPLGASVAGALAGSNQEGMRLLGISDPNAKPGMVVEAIDAFVYDWQKGRRPRDISIKPDDVPFALGSLWGEQMIRQFGWQWVKVAFLDRKNLVAHAVVSHDRSLVIYPFHFLMGCLSDSNVDATIMLSFNMLLANKTGVGEPYAYLNVMECVHRIVPRG